jgi:hypothetical protein
VTTLAPLHQEKAHGEVPAAGPPSSAESAELLGLDVSAEYPRIGGWTQRRRDARVAGALPAIPAGRAAGRREDLLIPLALRRGLQEVHPRAMQTPERIRIYSCIS